MTEEREPGRTSGAYPEDALDLRRMNRTLRHRLRNLCAGVKMTIDRVADVVGRDNTQLGDRCLLIKAEMDALQGFTERMDLLFDVLPQPGPLSLFEVLSELREDFVKSFPLCAFELEGPECDVAFPKGSWLLIALKELLRNAGEAAGAEGSVSLSWRLEKDSFSLEIVNGGEPFPPDTPLNPPQPFLSPKSRHDGLGLAIAFRICNEAAFKLDLRNRQGEGASASVLIPLGDFLNGQT